MTRFQHIRLGCKLTLRSLRRRQFELARMAARVTVRDVRLHVRNIVDVPGNWCATKLASMLNASNKSLKAHIMSWPEDSSTDSAEQGMRRYYEVTARSQFANEGYISHSSTERVTTFSATIAKLEFDRMRKLHALVEHCIYLVSPTDSDNPELIETIIGGTAQ